MQPTCSRVTQGRACQATFKGIRAGRQAGRQREPSFVLCGLLLKSSTGIGAAYQPHYLGGARGEFSQRYRQLDTAPSREITSLNHVQIVGGHFILHGSLTSGILSLQSRRPMHSLNMSRLSMHSSLEARIHTHEPSPSMPGYQASLYRVHHF